MKKNIFKNKIYLNTEPPTINNIQLYGNHSLRDLGFIDVLYPIGCYYETSNGSFNPEAQWGGQWELEIEGQIHVNKSIDHFTTISGALRNQSDGGSPNSIVVTHAHYYMSDAPQHTHSTIASRSGYNDTGSYDAMVPYQFGINGSYYSANAGNHTHTLIAQGVSGVGRNMPPYICVYRWHRIG